MEAVITGHRSACFVLPRRDSSTAAGTLIHCPPSFGLTTSLRRSSPISLGAEVSSLMRGGPVARSAGADNVTDLEKEGWATRQVKKYMNSYISP